LRQRHACAVVGPAKFEPEPWNCHQGMSVSAITARLLAFGPGVVGPLHGAGVFTY
jgi:hypothetical protein